MATKNKLPRVLIVEDNKPIVFSLVKKLRLVNVDTLVANNGRNGLHVALAEKPDLILLDIVMPIMSGIEMLETLREDKWGRKVPVIALTNLSDPYKEKHLRALGVKDILIKADTKIEEVIKKVKKVLHK